MSDTPTSGAELLALREHLETLEEELNLLWHHVCRELRLASKEDVIAMLEHELHVAEWAGYLIDGEPPSDELVHVAVSGTLARARDADAGVSPADVAYWLGEEMPTRRGVRALADILAGACERGLLTCVTNGRPSRYRLADRHG